MGFETRRTFELDFEGTAWSEAVVTLTSPTIDEVFEIYEGTAERELEIIAAHLVSWNLTLDGAEIPCTLAGLRQLEVAGKSLIRDEWLKATRGVTAPLARRSSDMQRSEEVPISMETL